MFEKFHVCISKEKKETYMAFPLPIHCCPQAWYFYDSPPKYIYADSQAV